MAAQAHCPTIETADISSSNGPAIVFFLTLFAVQLIRPSAVTAAPEDKPSWYQADLIVFLNKNDMYGREQWPDITPMKPKKNVTELKKLPVRQKSLERWLEGPFKRIVQPSTIESIDIERDPYVALPERFSLLKSEASILANRREYQLLAQMSWLFPIAPGDSGQTVAVQGIQTDFPAMRKLQGTIHINQTRFFHVSVDLWLTDFVIEMLSNYLTDPLATDTPLLQGTQPPIDYATQLFSFEAGSPMKIMGNYRLQTDTKLGVNNTQYIDSQVIGALFTLTPYNYPDKPVSPQKKPGYQSLKNAEVLPGITVKNRKSGRS